MISNYLNTASIIIFLTIITFLISCKLKLSSTTNGNTKSTELTYKNALIATKAIYPFADWRASYADGLEQYTEENCNEVKRVFDNLIKELISKGKDAPKEEKVKLFKNAVLSLNALNEKVNGLIETGERESLCDLIDKITIAAELNPKDYADGEGIADEWREW